MSSRCITVVARSRPLVALVLLVASLAGCASAAAPPPPPPAPSTSLEGVRRLLVVASGPSQFAAVPGPGSSEPTRVFDEVMKWLPYRDILVPIAQALQWGIRWLMEDRASSAAPRDVHPAVVVAGAFAQTLLAAGPVAHVIVTDREPVGETRRDADAIVRIAVPSWGVVRVQEGEPPVVASFADTRAEMVLRETGVIVWRHDEDVTHPERVPLHAFTKDRAAARERLTEVLERAGRRMASELVYAHGGR